MDSSSTIEDFYSFIEENEGSIIVTTHKLLGWVDARYYLNGVFYRWGWQDNKWLTNSAPNVRASVTWQKVWSIPQVYQGTRTEFVLEYGQQF